MNSEKSFVMPCDLIFDTLLKYRHYERGTFANVSYEEEADKQEKGKLQSTMPFEMLMKN